MDTLFTEIPSESAAAIEHAWEDLRDQARRMGVPTVEELMVQVDKAVLQLHGPVPPTPTWEEVVESWAATKRALEAPEPPTEIESAPQDDDIIDAEIVDEPAPLTTGKAAAKAIPVSTTKAITAK